MSPDRVLPVSILRRVDRRGKFALFPRIGQRKRVSRRSARFRERSRFTSGSRVSPD